MKGWRFCSIEMATLVIGLIGFSSIVLAGKEQFSILTTFSSEPVNELIAKYKQQNPDADIELIHRRSQSAMQLLNRSYIQGVDVVLSSSPFLFEALDKRDQLASLALEQNPPQWLEPFLFPIKNKVLSIGYSGAGIVWNREYLAANKLPIPTRFSDLSSFAYFGHITMSTPSRSATTQLMLESILARHGWQQGWATILNIGANLGTISSRSFGVSDYVSKGQFGIGPTIDSNAISQQRQFAYVGFTYDPDFTLMPTYIGIAKNATKTAEAIRFVELALSDDVQQRILQSSLTKRSIYDPALYLGTNPPLDFKKVMKREKLLNILFDEAITKRLPELQDIWLGLSHYVQIHSNDAARLEVAHQLLNQLFTIPVTEQEVNELANLISSQRDASTLEDGEEQALLVEFSYRFATLYEEGLERVEEMFHELQVEIANENM